MCFALRSQLKRVEPRQQIQAPTLRNCRPEQDGEGLPNVMHQGCGRLERGAGSCKSHSEKAAVPSGAHQSPSFWNNRNRCFPVLPCTEESLKEKKIKKNNCIKVKAYR